MIGSAALFLGMILSAPVGDPPRVAAFELSDAAGVKHGVAEWAGAKAVVLFFVWAECPASNGYAPEMARLAKAYAEKGVLVFGVHSDPDLTAAQAAEHAKEHALPFPMLLDPTQSLARQAGVTRAPTAVVLSPAGAVRYRGRIDNQYVSLGKKRATVTSRDAQDAIDHVLAGKAPATADTEVIGCLLPRLPDPPAKPTR